MNKAQLENDIKEMEARLASMKAVLGKPVKSKVFVPEIGQTYWWLSSSGTLSRFVFDDDESDKLHLALGNVYETEAEAEKAIEKKLATVRVLNKLRELEGDLVADWNDVFSRKYHICYNHLELKLQIGDAQFCQTNEQNSYSTKEACQWVIDNMQDDLKLMFGVE